MTPSFRELLEMKRSAGFSRLGYIRLSPHAG